MHSPPQLFGFASLIRSRSVPRGRPPPSPPFQGPRTAAGSRARRGGPPPMPGLVVFQHRWHVGADDLYLLAALSLLTNGLFLVAGAFP